MDLRPSPLAGLWYPARPDALAASVDALLAQASGSYTPGQSETPPEPDAVVGLLAPHAGHRFSGAVAAHAFHAVQGQRFDVVAVLSPSHYHADAPILTSAHAAYATPLGPVLVDQPALAALRAALARALAVPAGQAVPALRRDREHAIEIELPFLQRALAPGFSLLPLMLRDQGEPLARALGAALAEALRGRRALLVASSDLSHFSPQATALERDAALLQPLAALDPAGVLAVQAAGRGQACGAGAIAAVLWAAQALGANRARVVRHATSGDVTGDYDAVVGYAAALLWKC
jgi:AmmeMemoRadiSam system protein B